jgi:predicted RND superfamily exporter protein
MAATLVVATTIGVVVDDTIHLAYRYIDGLTELDLEPSGAAGYSVHKAGLAILITSVVLVAGLLVLVFSEFRMNSTFGICASLIIALALLYNMVVSPKLLKMVSGVRTPTSGS